MLSTKTHLQKTLLKIKSYYKSSFFYMQEISIDKFYSKKFVYSENPSNETSKIFNIRVQNIGKKYLKTY